MENYNFWQDFFDTYQSLSDWTKALWLIIPPAFVLGAMALVLRYRLHAKRIESQQTGTLKYTIICGETGNYRLYTHDSADKPDQPASRPPMLPLPPLPFAPPPATPTKPGQPSEGRSRGA